MHIVKDVRMILPRIHGIGRYLAETLKVWQSRGISHRITLLTNNRKVLEEQGFLSFYRAVEVKSKPFSPGEFIEIPKTVAGLKPDLYHAPSISVPLYEVAPTVVTIPDLTPFHFGGPFHRIYCGTILRNAVKYSKAIITISEFVKDDVVKTYRCSADKVFVTHLAVSDNPAPPVEWEELKSRFPIEKPYLFCLSNPKRHKNLTGLLDIYELFRKKTREKTLLVIGSPSSPELTEKIKNSSFAADIRLIDYMDDGLLKGLYANGEVFVFPSLYEGFGLPPLEAMKYGCPVVSSSRASLGEIVGNGGLLSDPEDMEDFSDKMALLMNNPDERHRWTEMGRIRSSEFTWEKCADLTMNIYERAVAAS